jgi:hypothetical protein
MKRITFLIFAGVFVMMASVALMIIYWLSRQNQLSLASTTLILAAVALSLTTINSVFGILNVIISRYRFLTVTDIRTVGYQSINMPSDTIESKFSIDIVNSGAPIWDISAEIEFRYPLNRAFVEAGVYGTFTWKLAATTNSNPLTTGQSIRFECTITKRHNTPHPLLVAPFISHELLAKIPNRNISVCVYSNDRPSTKMRSYDEPRHLLRRIRNRKLYVALSTFTEHAISFPSPTLWHRISYRIERWRERRVDVYIKRIRGVGPMDGPVVKRQEPPSSQTGQQNETPQNGQ